ncbi:MAG: SLBB domain-containing protein [Tannerellaceae bacterium]|nr:SLBB domain-containing protein [Tannerellaceae bacterium]
MEDNDMIIISPYEQLVTTTGKLKRNRIFEVKEGETLQQVIAMAGGFTEDAYTADVQVKRRTGERYRIATVTRDKFSTFIMHDGDSLLVDSVIPFYENRLTITGAVWRPGEYELNEKVNSVRTLVDQAKGLKGDEFMGRAQITRLNPDFTNSVITVDIRGIINGTVPDIALMPEDILHIPSLFDLREAYTIKVSGAVNIPDTILPYSHNMTVEDAIILAGGLSEAAATINVEVARRIKNTTSVVSTNRIAEEYTFTLNDNLEIISGQEAFTLMPFDEVFIRFSPGYSTQQVITIGGEVAFAGNYVLAEKNSRLSDIIAKAGGVTVDAYV